ncbi:integrator complex subunit 6-like [Paramacrobiotus metropolitanus]|uniref:integrator complex subunit 6-like n=1 Tax=Paramacrobiotus metropolitanus TaxID=2943436 RepID=UPI0024460FA9|nr:integrator complex subunit 6-like [Paramacrobiotus metropolitanus]XP_055353000.1 integrator complex subunit 6-like [Paramacrobiotus metropolitanus]XP_055353008.1 integrator complex subunit 6-like [Paramacrobiotus metropolitanus]XP_055353016.1 integrator complex subunit 6-like [Paramacrobiotus metropolitanus]XP_055353024.1 integrator complex subunit 6-like [Paramacrobiotus metropolitanus]XP_055353032.1 integrator complex subunit 6-like [Paramacrobiotus metropolitanus]XP_055353039.1 integrat
MAIILFIVDNSISMCQKTYFGCSLLDVAKKALETFLKFRARDFNHRLDRIMLMNFDDPPTHLKVGWRESLVIFQNEVKNMQATAVSNGSQIISSAFEMLNVNRLQSGIDTYGQGRNPFFVESAVIILLTDGHSFSSTSDLNIAINNRIPGMELTKEPYRWDQRFFSVVFRIPGVRSDDKLSPDDLPRDNSVLEGFSSMTGGRSFLVDSVKAIDLVMLKIADSMQIGVMVRLEPLEEHNFTSTSIAVNKMIYLPRNPQKAHATGHWPLPEGFWPDNKTLPPPRTAHPVLKYRPCMEDVPNFPLLGDSSFPVDRYEVESSPLTQEIAEKSERFKHWQVYVDADHLDSGTIHQMCGYLAVQPTGPENAPVLTLSVLPIDYPRLFDLFEKFGRNPNRKEWKSQFDAYVQSIPGYSVAALRRYLLKVNLHTLVPETFDQPSFDLQNYLKRVKTQAKLIFDSTQAFFNLPPAVPELIPVIQRSWKNFTKRDVMSGDERDLSGQKDAFDVLLAKSIAEQNESEAATFKMHLRPPTVLLQRANIVLHRNPFDVEREDLVSHIGHLKFSLLYPDRWKGTENSDKSIPIAQMGNYQDHIKNAVPPLREIDDTLKVERQNVFGNPFVNKKKQRSMSLSVPGGMGGMVDEADIDMTGASGMSRQRRGLSEPRDFAPSIQISKVRSRSSTPAGLSSPVKSTRHEPEPEATAKTSSTSPVEPPATPPSPKRRLYMVPPEPLAPSNSLEEMAVDNDAPTDLPLAPVTNGITDENNEVMDEQTLDDDIVQQCRLRALKAIKTPGRNFKPILDMINELNGNMHLRKAVVDKIIVEAGRFRRESLISLLKETYAL